CHDTPPRARSLARPQYGPWPVIGRVHQSTRLLVDAAFRECPGRDENVARSLQMTDNRRGCQLIFFEPAIQRTEGTVANPHKNSSLVIAPVLSRIKRNQAKKRP